MTCWFVALVSCVVCVASRRSLLVELMAYSRNSCFTYVCEPLKLFTGSVVYLTIPKVNLIVSMYACPLFYGLVCTVVTIYVRAGLPLACERCMSGLCVLVYNFALLDQRNLSGISTLCTVRDYREA
jgi:membrane-associated HD superfamily phosphohydrolase